MSTSLGQPTTVGGGYWPQTLHHSAKLEESRDEYNQAEAYPKRKRKKRRTKMQAWWKWGNHMTFSPSCPVSKPWHQQPPCSRWPPIGDIQGNRAAGGYQDGFNHKSSVRRKEQHLSHDCPPMKSSYGANKQIPLIPLRRWGLRYNKISASVPSQHYFQS